MVYKTCILRMLLLLRLISSSGTCVTDINETHKKGVLQLKTSSACQGDVCSRILSQL